MLRECSRAGTQVTGIALLGCGLLAAHPAFAQDPEYRAPSWNHIRGVRLDLHADFGGYASLGAGLRLDIPLFPAGIFHGADDELALGLGIDGYFEDLAPHYYEGGPYLVPSCVGQWNFYFGSRWSLFGEAGLAVYVGDGAYFPSGYPVYAVPDLGMGARYHFSPRNALLVRISTPTGLQLGFTF